jgi:glycosyltransferase involved in cell wall biosynthesis
MKITAAIVTFNEAENIRDACESVAWVDEIVVVDSDSSDATRDIAADCGARVINHPWPGFALQKQFATDQAVNDWILSLDADERVSGKLKLSILKLVDQDPAKRADGYLIPRRSFYMGRWIRGGGWYPDRQLRLFKKSLARWKGPHIHESVKMNAGARVEVLSGDLLHYPARDATYHHRMIGRALRSIGRPADVRKRTTNFIVPDCRSRTGSLSAQLSTEKRLSRWPGRT